MKNIGQRFKRNPYITFINHDKAKPPYPVIGIDFDNTIVSYDTVFHKMASARGWIRPGTSSDKKSVRNEILASSGNDRWTQLQGIVYSEGILEAGVAQGFVEFMKWVRRSRLDAFVISHKTEFAAGNPSINLRKPAMDWLRRNDFFDPGGLGFDPQKNIFFEGTLREKLDRIRSCHCSHFIDDHTDVLLDARFPPETTPIFYNPTGKPRPKRELREVKHWSELKRYFRDENGID